MKVLGALFLIGAAPGTKTYEDVTEVIAEHLEDGRIYSSVALPGIWRGMPVFARAVGTGELCLQGQCLSWGEERVPHPADPERWPLSYEIDFLKVLRRVHVADAIGPKAAKGRRVRGMDQEAVQRARRAFEDGVPPRTGSVGPSEG